MCWSAVLCAGGGGGETTGSPLSPLPLHPSGEKLCCVFMHYFHFLQGDLMRLRFCVHHDEG